MIGRLFMLREEHHQNLIRTYHDTNTLIRYPVPVKKTVPYCKIAVAALEHSL